MNVIVDVGLLFALAAGTYKFTVGRWESDPLGGRAFAFMFYGSLACAIVLAVSVWLLADESAKIRCARSLFAVVGMALGLRMAYSAAQRAGNRFW